MMALGLTTSICCILICLYRIHEQEQHIRRLIDFLETQMLNAELLSINQMTEAARRRGMPRRIARAIAHQLRTYAGRNRQKGQSSCK